MTPKPWDVVSRVLHKVSYSSSSVYRQLTYNPNSDITPTRVLITCLAKSHDPPIIAKLKSWAWV